MKDDNKYERLTADALKELPPELTPGPQEKVKITCSKCGHSFETELRQGWQELQMIWCHSSGSKQIHTVEKL